MGAVEYSGKGRNAGYQDHVIITQCFISRNNTAPFGVDLKHLQTTNLMWAKSVNMFYGLKTLHKKTQFSFGSRLPILFFKFLFSVQIANISVAVYSRGKFCWIVGNVGYRPYSPIIPNFIQCLITDLKTNVISNWINHLVLRIKSYVTFSNLQKVLKLRL